MFNAVLSLSILSLSFLSLLPKVTPNLTCPEVPTCENFDIFKFQGSWFVHGMFYSPLSELPDGNTSCSIITYSVDYGGTMNIVEEVYHIERNETQVTDFQGFIPDLTDASKWKLAIPGARSIGDYWILDTDYVNYAVPLLCGSLVDRRWVAAWVITRERYPSKFVVNTAFFSAYRYGIKKSDFSLFNQAIC